MSDMHQYLCTQSDRDVKYVDYVQKRTFYICTNIYKYVQRQVDMFNKEQILINNWTDKLHDDELCISLCTQYTSLCTTGLDG